MMAILIGNDPAFIDMLKRCGFTDELIALIRDVSIEIRPGDLAEMNVSMLMPVESMHIKPDPPEPDPTPQAQPVNKKKLRIKRG